MLKQLVYYLKLRYGQLKGQGMVEYALVVAFVAFVAAVVFDHSTKRMTGFGGTINGVVNLFNNAVNAILK